MRNLIFMLVVMVMFSCQDDNNGADIQFTNYIVSVEKNGAYWEGILGFDSHETVPDTLIIRATNFLTEEHIVMKIKFQGEGQYPLLGNQAIYFTTLGGDVITSEYRIDPNSTAQLTITKYEAAENWIEGNFEMVLEKVMSNPENNIDSLHFTNGSFAGEIIIN